MRGVWEQSAPPKFRQAGFTHLEFIDVIEAEANGVRSITTYIVDPAKPEPVGFVERAYDSRTNTFEMRNAFLEDVPNKIQPATGDTLTSGGTPTQTYLTLHQMKALGVEYGGLKKVKMSTIQNLQSIIELELHSRTMPLDEAVRKTYSLTYAETPIVQSGHRIVDVKFGGTPKKTRFDVLLEWYERHNSRDKPRDPEIVKKHDEIITNHGDGKVTRDTQVRWNYDIEITLAPFSGHNP